MQNRIEQQVRQEVKLSTGVSEGPLWSASEQCLYWLDIPNAGLYRYFPLGSRLQQVVLPEPVSALAFCPENRLLGVAFDRLVFLDFDKTALIKARTDMAVDKGHRFNDARVDQQGRLWAGTMRMDLSSATGNLYCIFGDLEYCIADSGLTVSNGLDWSPDGKTFYLVDTVPGKVYAYDVDPASGALADKRVFATFAGSEGKPDGICVDSKGYLWCALWDGWCIKRFAPDGRLDLSLPLPVPRPTSLTFGGQDLKTLFITTASTGLSGEQLMEAPWSGSLLACEPGVAGQASGQFGLDAMQGVANA